MEAQAHTSVRFPEIREDLLDGYQWVLDELPKLAPVDPARNFVFGGSAGGYATLSVVSKALTSPPSPNLTSGNELTGPSPSTHISAASPCRAPTTPPTPSSTSTRASTATARP